MSELQGILVGIFAAYGHVFRPIQTSASIGWSTSPYKYEVGMADLTVGVLGILCLKFRGNFWLATAIANAVWLLGDAVGHVRQVVLYNNHASNNSGVFLVAEFIVPLLIFVAYAVSPRPGNRPPGLNSTQSLPHNPQHTILTTPAGRPASLGNRVPGCSSCGGLRPGSVRSLKDDLRPSRRGGHELHPGDSDPPFVHPRPGLPTI